MDLRQGPQRQAQTYQPEPTTFSPSVAKGKKCPYCPSEFRKADHFHRHVRSHTKEKPFRCHVCRKSYPRHDTLLRHSRIHKQDSDDIRQSEIATLSDAHGSLQQDDSPPSNVPPVPRAMSLSGVGTTEQLTPASYSTTASLAQMQQEDVQILPGGTAPTILQDGTNYSMTAAHDLQSRKYGVTPLYQLQPSSSMLPSPSIIDSDAPFVARSVRFSARDPPEAPIFEELSGYGSTHWLLEDDFDFTVFEHLGFSSALHEPQITNNVEPLPRRLPTKPRQAPVLSDLRQIWYIQMPDDRPDTGSGTITPADRAVGSLDDIDETYRNKLAVTLRPAIRDEPLPSIEFLNLCIHLFFTKFNVALPLIHSPTFRPQHSNALLVLSLCSAGCLSMGSESAAKTGAMLFERVNKTILVVPWERFVPRTNDHTWNIIKAGMIGQTYALTSEDPAHRATAAAYHGSMISLARQHKLLSPTPALKLHEDLTPEQLDKAWRTWAKQEELKRVAVMLYIHDAEIAALFHHEPVFRHSAGYIPTMCSHELFSAPSAATWAPLFRAEQHGIHLEGINSGPEIPTTAGGERLERRNRAKTTLQQGLGYQTMFNVYNNLSGIAASITECRHLDLLSFPTVNKFESDLLTWYSSTPIAFKMFDHSKRAETPFSLLPLWHHNFMNLCTDFNLLEIAVGREGSEVAPSAREYVLSWTASPDSKRCLLHALFLQNLIVATNLGALVAIHTPRVLFSAALCWHCYTLYAQEIPSAPSLLDGTLESLNALPEIQLLREYTSHTSVNFYPMPHILDETLAGLPRILAANPAEMKANTLCVIESILRRLGTGGISLCFADIIQVFIFGTTDKSGNDENTS